MTERERQAAIDALADLLGMSSKSNKGPTGIQIPPEYRDAWNKIMQTYDNDNTTVSDLEDLLQKIVQGQLTEI